MENGSEKTYLCETRPIMDHDPPPQNACQYGKLLLIQTLNLSRSLSDIKVGLCKVKLNAYSLLMDSTGCDHSKALTFSHLHPTFHCSVVALPAEGCPLVHLTALVRLLQATGDNGLPSALCRTAAL